MTRFVILLLTVLFSLFVFWNYRSWTQHYESYKLASTNPYLSFNEIFKCQCDLNQAIVNSPYLKIEKMSQSFSDTDKNTYWILRNNLEGRNENQNLYLKYGRTQCDTLILSTGDLVMIKGHIEKLNELVYVIVPDKGYIESQGKKHCLQN